MFSYVSSALANLPLSTAYAGTLSSNVQRQILRYIIKRALGRLIKDGDVKIDQIEAGLGSGKVEIRNVHLDVDSINSFLLSTNVRLSSGLVGSISIAVPWTNLLSGELQIEIANIDAQFTLVKQQQDQGQRATSLGESILSVAEEVFEDDEEGRQLEASIASSIGDEQTDDAPAPQSSAWADFIARQMGNIMARTSVSLSNIILRISCETGSDPRNDTELQLRCDKIHVKSSAPKQEGQFAELHRTISVDGISVWLDVQKTADPGDDKESSSASSERDFGMAQSTADLQDSMATSMYASAIEAESEDASVQSSIEVRESVQRGFTSEFGVQMIAKLSAEPLILHISSTPSPTDISNDAETAPPKLSASLQIETIAVHLTPHTIASLMTFARGVMAIVPTGNQQGAADAAVMNANFSNRANSQVEFSCKEAHLVFLYDFPDRLDQQRYTLYRQSCQEFWTRPARCSPTLGHLRLRVQDVRSSTQVESNITKHHFSIADVGLYEYLSPDHVRESGDMRCLPIFVFDEMIASSVKESSVATEEDERALPSTASSARTLRRTSASSIDWRTFRQTTDRGKPNLPYRRTDFSDKGWKFKAVHHARRTSNDSRPQSLQQHPCITIISRDGHLEELSKIQLVPIHIFLDTSLADRMLPLIHFFAKAAKREVQDKAELSASNASFETVRAGASSEEVLERMRTTASARKLQLDCPLIRIEVRVHTSLMADENTSVFAEGRHSTNSTSGYASRTGIMLVDIRDVAVSTPTEDLQQQGRRTSAVHFALPDLSASSDTRGSRHETIPKAILSMSKVMIYYKDIMESRAELFATVGALDSDDEAEASIMPVVSYGEGGFHGAGPESRYTSTDCRLPMAHIALSKPLLDGVELMVDDLSLWAAHLREWISDSESDRASDALRILGSRFFGMRQSYSTLSSSSTSTESVRPTQPKPVFTLRMYEIDVMLHLSNNAERPEIIRLRGSGLDVRFNGQHGPNSTCTTVALAVLKISHQSSAKDNEQATTILEQTVRPSLSHAARPTLSVQLISTNEPGTSFRASQIDVLAQNFTLVYNGDDRMVHELLAFGRSPEGAFEHVQPNEITRISLRVKDVSVLLAPILSSSRAVCVVGDLSMRTKLVSDFPQSVFRFALDDTSAWCGESIKAQAENEARSRRPSDIWSARGLSQLSLVKNVRATATLSTLTRPEVDVKVSQSSVEIMACADTIKVVEDIARSLAPSPPRKTQEAHSSGDEKAEQMGAHVADVDISMDEDAFRKARTVASTIDLLDDDVPRNPNFLRSDTQWRASNIDKSAALRQAQYDNDLLGDDDADDEEQQVIGSAPSSGAEKKRSKILLEDEVVVVRLLDVEHGVSPTPKYFTNPELCVTNDNEQANKLTSSMRLRVQGCDVTIRLFGGYDCQTTRTAIEEEAKRVRRRLQKIKQMLDQGQAPDDSVEEATANLFDSVHVSLPGGVAAAEMDAAALMQIVDEELDDRSETASSASTWKQFVPIRTGSPGSSSGRGGGTATLTSTSKLKRRRYKLARSRDSMIDIELKGIRLDYDEYAPASDLASRIGVRVKTVRILDNVPTSTWQTFLTGIAMPHDITASDSMIRVELINVRPTKTAADTVEIRCKARITPIRLHVDQDALDFLKKFFTFELPGQPPQRTSATDAEAEKGPGAFIQHAEIYAVKLKLDYKPKRVDYRLLRQGKTIEMMNFFNFEGSEITLRHVTLRGIMGWTTLFDTLNDLWTPDVKSNQLADVLSGITPIRSLVNVGNGMADLILLPIEQYQRDGRLGKGLREGAKRFAMTTALEAARIGARLATGTQVILERAETVLGGGQTRSPERQSELRKTTQSRRSGNDDEDTANVLSDLDGDSSMIAVEPSPPPRISRYANQPDGMRQALDEAQRGLTRGFNEAAQTILAVPMEVYDRQAGEGGNRPVIRAVPIAVLKGAAGATEAVSKTLQGIQRELAGVQLAEHQQQEEKYKRKPDAGQGQRR